MIKRVVWMGVGAAAGSAGTLWAQRKVRVQIERAAEKLTPSHQVRVVRDRVGTIGDRVRDAVVEGRVVMNETEADLRDRVDARSTTRAPSSLPPSPSARSAAVPR